MQQPTKRRILALIKIISYAWRCGSVAECLPSLHTALALSTKHMQAHTHTEMERDRGREGERERDYILVGSKDNKLSFDCYYQSDCYYKK